MSIVKHRKVFKRIREGLEMFIVKLLLSVVSSRC